ncbi:hypothetical protein VKT23_007814 [Stygiomarasmius scandens]|uniref:Uncharacterized protein n=1 Tax=Marasmiellus scandens TaxID=2682957 RepID=A0ABR1JIG9_9AGAR
MVRLTPRQVREDTALGGTVPTSTAAVQATSTPSNAASPTTLNRSQEPSTSTGSITSTVTTPSSSSISSQNQSTAQDSENNHSQSSQTESTTQSAASSQFNMSSGQSTMQLQPQTSSLVTTDQSGATRTIVMTVTPTATESTTSASSSSSTSSVNSEHPGYLFRCHPHLCCEYSPNISRFFKNTPAVIGTFGALGVLALVLMVFFIMYSIRKRRAKSMNWDRDREIWKKATGIALGMGLSVEEGFQKAKEEAYTPERDNRKVGEISSRDDTSMGEAGLFQGSWSRSRTGSLSETASQGTFGAYDQAPVNFASYTFPRPYSSHTHSASLASFASYTSHSTNISPHSRVGSTRSQFYQPQPPLNHPLQQQHTPEMIGTGWNEVLRSRPSHHSSLTSTSGTSDARSPFEAQSHRGRPTPSRRGTLPQSVLDAAGISADEEDEASPPVPHMHSPRLASQNLSDHKTDGENEDVQTSVDHQFQPPTRAWGFLEPGPRLSSAPSTPYGQPDCDPFATAFVNAMDGSDSISKGR